MSNSAQDAFVECPMSFVAPHRIIKTQACAKSCAGGSSSSPASLKLHQAPQSTKHQGTDVNDAMWVFSKSVPCLQPDQLRPAPPAGQRAAVSTSTLMTPRASRCRRCALHVILCMACGAVHAHLLVATTCAATTSKRAPEACMGDGRSACPVRRLVIPESGPVCSCKQVVVVFMSVGFIVFVTVLHIVGKVSRK